MPDEVIAGFMQYGGGARALPLFCFSTANKILSCRMG
jgi:hypothetical protein